MPNIPQNFDHRARVLFDRARQVHEELVRANKLFADDKPQVDDARHATLEDVAKLLGVIATEATEMSREILTDA